MIFNCVSNLTYLSFIILFKCGKWNDEWIYVYCLLLMWKYSMFFYDIKHLFHFFQICFEYFKKNSSTIIVMFEKINRYYFLFQFLYYYNLKVVKTRHRQWWKKGICSVFRFLKILSVGFQIFRKKFRSIFSSVLCFK